QPLRDFVGQYSSIAMTRQHHWASGTNLLNQRYGVVNETLELIGTCQLVEQHDERPRFAKMPHQVAQVPRVHAFPWKEKDWRAGAERLKEHHRHTFYAFF